MSVQGAVRLFSPVGYGIGAILPLEVFQQEAFFIFTVFADTPSADKVFISFDLKNRPSATVVISCVEAVAHILPQPLEQPFFPIRLTYVPYKIGKLQIQGFSEPTTPNKIKQSYHITQKAARSRPRAAFLRGKLGRRQDFSKK